MYNTCIVLVQYNDDTVHMVMLIYIYIIYSCTVHVQLLYSRSTLLNMASGLFLSNTELHEIYPSSSTDQVLYMNVQAIFIHLYINNSCKTW